MGVESKLQIITVPFHVHLPVEYNSDRLQKLATLNDVIKIYVYSRYSKDAARVLGQRPIFTEYAGSRSI